MDIDSLYNNIITILKLLQLFQWTPFDQKGSSLMELFKNKNQIKHAANLPLHMLTCANSFSILHKRASTLL